jgi:adenylate cyclase
MAIFNAPLDLEDYIFKAVCTALEIQQGAEKLKNKISNKFGIQISFGIGVNFGTAVVGNIGAAFRMEYTAIGDTVNTASRLENTANPDQILISDTVYESLKDRIKVTPLGEHLLRGKTKDIFVYQLDGLVD